MTAHLKVSEEVVSSALGDKVILLHLGNSLYYTLGPTAAATWRHIREGAPLEAIPALLAAEFNVEPAQVEQDVRHFLSELFTNDILLTM